MREYTNLRFDDPDHKSLGTRRKSRESVVNFWWIVPPCYRLFPKVSLVEVEDNMVQNTKTRR